MKTFGMLLLLVVFGGSFTLMYALAGDLDDGISEYTEDSIDKYDEIGKADRNVKFIVLNAKSKAAMNKDGKSGEKRSGTVVSQNGDANMNSVLMGAGSNVKGDIIIIDQGKGNRVNVAE